MPDAVTLPLDQLFVSGRPVSAVQLFSLLPIRPPTLLRPVTAPVAKLLLTLPPQALLSPSRPPTLSPVARTVPLALLWSIEPAPPPTRPPMTCSPCTVRDEVVRVTAPLLAPTAPPILLRPVTAAPLDVDRVSSDSWLKPTRPPTESPYGPPFTTPLALLPVTVER